jgi:Zn-dependent membrane protease YugP
MFLFWDYWYFVFVLPGMLLAAWAQWRVSSAYARASRIPPRSGMCGAEAASAMLHAAGVDGVRILPVDGFLSDHYVPGKGILYLSPGVYAQRSLAAVGIAAHEAGHALQDAYRYPLLAMRNFLVPAAGIGSNFAWIAIIIGLVLNWTGLTLIGIGLFSLVVIFQLVNLPVEFDASRRARLALVDGGIITPEEDVEVARVLNAAALTYVAATLTSVLILLYYLFRAGLLGGSSRD